MKINAYGKSSIGKVRKLNEDSFSFNSSYGDKGSIFVVCDGMGGHKAGEVASNYASVKVVEYFYNSKQRDILSKLNESIKKVNSDLYKLSSKDISKRGMGTTLVAAVIYENILYFANVGDSRAYIIRNDSIGRLTKDHSWIEEKINDGSLTPQEAKNNPNKNILTKCVGYEPDVEPYFGSFLLKEGDRIILCSDGLWNELNEKEIKNIALFSSDLKKSVDNLIYKAEERGGKDNITVLAIDYGKVKTKTLSKYKKSVPLLVSTFFAIFFLILSILTIILYKNDKSNLENKVLKLQQQLSNIIENSKIQIEKLNNEIIKLKNRNEELVNEVENLKKENGIGINDNNFLDESLEDNNNLVLELEDIEQLNLNYFVNPKDYFTGFENVKKFFVYNKNLYFQTDEDLYNLFLINNTKNDIFKKNFKIEFTDKLIEINELIFDKNSQKFYLLSNDYIYEGILNDLLSNSSKVLVKFLNKNIINYPNGYSEADFIKFLLVDNELYYFLFFRELNEFKYFKILGQTGELYAGIIKLDEIDEKEKNLEIKNDIYVKDIVYDSINKKLILLLKNSDKNILYFYNNNHGVFEFNNSQLIKISKYFDILKILTNQNISDDLIFLCDNNKIYLYNIKNQIAYRCYELSFPNGKKYSEIIDVILDNSTLFFLLDNADVFSSEFN